MIIKSSFWTESINMLIILCSCGHEFNHRSDRWVVKCPSCKNKENLQTIRIKYLEQIKNTNELKLTN